MCIRDRNQIDKFPNDTFLWKGIDGTGILTHLITTPGVGQDIKNTHFTTYNGMLDADAVIEMCIRDRV